MKNIYLLILFHWTYLTFSQIGIGTTSPNQSAILEVSSTNKGLLPPKMTLTQRNNIDSPAEGLIIYNLTEHCLQINEGSSISPDWSCIGKSSGGVESYCDINGFEGVYVAGKTLTSSHVFSLTIINNSFTSITINFSTGDLVLSGISGVTVSSVNPTSSVLASGSSISVDYTLTGTPASVGTLTGTWNKLSLNCIKNVTITSGDANFNLPEIRSIVSIHDGSPLANIQGVIDNGSNQLTIDLPYSEGVGSYEAYTGVYTPNNVNAGEGGDMNNFRLSYPAGTFSSTGTITATIEVDGDGSFNVKKQLFGIESTLSSLDFQINGNSKGYVNIVAIGGIKDRNFADPNHKFIYIPIIAADGKTWLNNNLGANYSNLNHAQFNPSRQASHIGDVHAYGSSFQWGRYSDGHEFINYINSTTGYGSSSYTSYLSTTDDPGHNQFIGGTTGWRSPINNSLWQGESSVNNPCPEGYRVPTRTELTTLISNEGITNNSSAFNSSLTIPNAGYRENSGKVDGENFQSMIWSNSISSGSKSYAYMFLNDRDLELTLNHSQSANVRCIKD